jgi:hypothetical protein
MQVFAHMLSVAIKVANAGTAAIRWGKGESMDELVNLVVQKTGISQEDARKAVEVVISTLKSRLPGPIASHVDALIAGGVSGEMDTLAGEATDLLKGKLGGLFSSGGKA